jgi:3D (Asp-Asp-Asp) domain-containing protein
MKNIINTIIVATTITTNKPAEAKEIINKQIENKVEQNKTIGIKARSGYKQMKKIQGTEMRVGATAYYGDTITSTGTVPKVGYTIAVDPKVIPYGTRVYIPQLNKIFVAEDCGSAIKGNRIDIFMNTYEECMEWGYKDITIIILDK